MTKHGQAKKTPEYLAWTHMKTRCGNKNYEGYHNYGGNGVSVCERWINSFENFFADMGKRPTSKHSLDRFPDVSGSYGPTNCRWATPKEQSGNRRNNRWIEYEGQRMILQDWSIYLGTTPQRILKSLRAGLLFSDIYERCKQKQNLTILDTQTGVFYEKLKDAAFAKNILPNTLYNKLSGFRANNTGLMYV